MLQFHSFSISANLAQSSKLFGTAGRMPLAMSLAMQEIWQPQVRSCLSARRSSLRWRYEPCQISVQIFPHTTIGCLGCTPHHINTYIYICSDRPRIIQNNIPWHLQPLLPSPVKTQTSLQILTSTGTICGRVIGGLKFVPQKYQTHKANRKPIETEQLWRSV